MTVAKVTQQTIFVLRYTEPSKLGTKKDVLKCRVDDSLQKRDKYFAILNFPSTHSRVLQKVVFHSSVTLQGAKYGVCSVVNRDADHA